MYVLNVTFFRVVQMFKHLFYLHEVCFVLLSLKLCIDTGDF